MLLHLNRPACKVTPRNWRRCSTTRLFWHMLCFLLLINLSLKGHFSSLSALAVSNVDISVGSDPVRVKCLGVQMCHGSLVHPRYSSLLGVASLFFIGFYLLVVRMRQKGSTTYQWKSLLPILKWLWVCGFFSLFFFFSWRHISSNEAEVISVIDRVFFVSFKNQRWF